jgi:hypothetical protein
MLEALIFPENSVWKHIKSKKLAKGKSVCTECSGGMVMK